MRSTTALVKLFMENGFTLARAKNHQVWKCPCGHTQVVVPSTPCRGRGDANTQATIRRTLRVCAQNGGTKP